MDWVLQVADDVVLDKVYATLFPLENAWSVGEADSARHATTQNMTMLGKMLFPSTTPALLSSWPREYMPRQYISLAVMTWVAAFILYFSFAALGYYFIFDHKLMEHPKFLKNQIRREILLSVKGFAPEALLMAAVFLPEVRGHSMLYKNLSDYGEGWRGLAYAIFSAFAFILFTDAGIYYIHWWLHWPSVYKVLHKPHHMWKIPTPFASHAFHPLDGFAQSVPYHAFVFLFPLHRFLYIGLFVFVNLWSVLIHDGDLLSSNAVINGASHHTLHHLSFTVNYGQYTTLFDRLMGTHREPTEAEIALRMGPAKRKASPAGAESMTEKKGLVDLADDVEADEEVDSQGGQFVEPRVESSVQELKNR